MIQPFQKSVEYRRKAGSVEAKANLLRHRWSRLCETFLPVRNDGSFWRFSRDSQNEEPTQGWKLHISATVLKACDIFERVAPYLISSNVQFKAPASLDELVKINSGLQYGYHQVGKFITIYPATTEKAVKLAAELHKLTSDFQSISVPFDERYLPESSVFYRYGAFRLIEIVDRHGGRIPVIKNTEGDFVFDDREKAVPDWLSDPFQDVRPACAAKIDNKNNPLVTKYRIFRAITQRGKGGTYQAVDISRRELRLCVVKEGRKNGEIGWNGQDGFFLVRNESKVLHDLRKKYPAVPQVYSSFQVQDNFYLVMENIEGKSLQDMMNRRRRRFSNKQIVAFAVQIAQIIEKIHDAGWIWNDCKPANLIVTENKKLRPIDFEASFPIDRTDPFDWKTAEFSKSTHISSDSNSKSADIYAFGAVLYYLLTGVLFDPTKDLTIKHVRSSTPDELISLVEKLLFNSLSDISQIRLEIEKISELFERFKDRRIF